MGSSGGLIAENSVSIPKNLRAIVDFKGNSEGPSGEFVDLARLSPEDSAHGRPEAVSAFAWTGFALDGEPSYARHRGGRDCHPCRTPPWRELLVRGMREVAADSRSCPNASLASPGFLSIHESFYESSVPRVNCPEHGVKNSPVLWAEGHSRFTILFE